MPCSSVYPAIITERLASHKSALSAMRSRPNAPLRLFECETIKKAVLHSSPMLINGARICLISFLLPMLTSAGIKPCTGSNTHKTGLNARIALFIFSDERSSPFKIPSLSSIKSGVIMFFKFAPASLNLRFNFFLTLSSVVINITFPGSL